MKFCPQCGYVPPKREAYTEGFDVFWDAYPRKAGKGAARKVWSRIKPDQIMLSEMILAIQAQSETDGWKAQGGIYIPHPSTWLNGERWLDETQRKQEKPKYDPQKVAQKNLEMEAIRDRLWNQRNGVKT